FTRRLELLVRPHLEGLRPSRPHTAQRNREGRQAEERISRAMSVLDSDLPGRKGHFTLPSPDKVTIWPFSLLPVTSASVAVIFRTKIVPCDMLLVKLLFLKVSSPVRCVMPSAPITTAAL